MKKLISTLCILLLLTSNFTYAEEYTDITIVIDGQEVMFENAPVIVEGTTLAPLRAVFEQLGLEVLYNDEDRSITGTADDVNIWLQLDNKIANVNGVEIEIDVAPFIIEGRTYVPLRFLAESTGCEVGWIDDTRTVTISRESEDLKALREKIEYVCDEKLFLIYAFINYTGFDYENGSNYSYVRADVRKKLNGMNLGLIDDKFYLNHKDQTKDDRSYWDWYENTTALPEMAMIDRDEIPEALHTLDENLKEFYVEANIHDLYLSYQSEYEKEFSLYSDGEVLTELLEILEFIKVDVNEIDDFVIAINPMGVSQTGHASPIDGKYYVTVGPYYGEANVNNLIHEYLHTHVNPALDALPDEIERSRKLGEFRNYKNEAFVIALQVFYMEDEAEREQYIRYQAEKRGYDKLEDVYNRFTKDFPSFEGTLEEFIVQVVESYINQF